MTNPIRPTDPDARALAQTLLAQARHAALGVLTDGAPLVTRISFVRLPQGPAVTLVSDLSQHTQALRADPRCSVLVGEPGAKGDPLTHPRLTLQATAQFIAHGDDGFAVLRGPYLDAYPKAKLYIDFADFSFVRFEIEGAFLNGGFGKAFVLTAQDLDLP